MPIVQTGIDRLFSEEMFDFGDRRVGLLVHPASVNSQLKQTLEIFRSQPGVNLTQLFGPEHGIWGSAQDMEGIDSTLDPITQLPVKSLYGSSLESLKPTTDDLAGIDLLVCDLQDVGSRYYTFIYTMAYCLEAASQSNKEVIVLDRPNPINGLDIEGKILKKGFESFVGCYPLPVRHGMTIGELAAFFNEEFNIECDLHVVKMKGWKRSCYFDQTGLPWVMPSPNMPSPDTALVYPGSCLIEGTNLSEGRGTTRPFEFVGAPFIAPHCLAQQLAEMKLEGAVFRPTFFKPTFHKWKGKVCGGIQIHVTDRKKFRPVATGVAIIKAVIDLYPNDFDWREPGYEFVKDIPAIDLLTGDSTLRKKWEAHAPLESLTADWKEGLDDFLKKRKKYLLYEG